MVAGYLKIGNLKNARVLFERMSERNVISWEALISGYLSLIMRQLVSFRGSWFKMLSLTKSLCWLHFLLVLISVQFRLGEFNHYYIDEHGLYGTIPLNNAVVNVYARIWKQRERLYMYIRI